MASNYASKVAKVAFYAELQRLNLRSVTRIKVRFDPFHNNVTPIREFLFHVSSSRVRKTSDKCTIKTEIVNDRSEPVLNVFLDSGQEVLFKTAQLSALEVVQEFNKIVERFDVPEESSQVALKSFSSDSYKKKKRKT